MTSVAAPAHLKMLIQFILDGHLELMKRRHFKWMILIIQHLFLLIRPLILLTQWTGQLERRASCHESPEVFKGLRASMPRVNGSGELETIPELVNNCRTERMGAEKWKWSGGKMAGMVGLIGLQSRGMTVDVAINGPASSMWEKGKELYYQRVGQLDMSALIAMRIIMVI